MAKTHPARRRYLDHRNRLWRLLRACEKVIEKTYPRFSLTGVPCRDPSVVAEVIRSGSLLLLLPEYRQTTKYWLKGGFRGFLKTLRPANLDDLVLGNALYRPGPLASGMADIFIERRKPSIPHRGFRPILGPTRGAVLFHEQIIEIATALAGFSTAEADSLRRAASKRNEAEMAEFRKIFIRGAGGNAIPPKAAVSGFEKIAHEGAYACSRAWCHESMLCLYQLSYVKRYFPVELRFCQRSVSAKFPEAS